MTSEELKQLEKTLWEMADNLRANSDLKSSEYATPVLGLIFLKFADNKYSQYENEIQKEYERLQGKRIEREIHEIAIEKCGFYLPNHARYEYLLNLPENEDIANAIMDAMKSIEEYKDDLRGTLQFDYNRLNRIETPDKKIVFDNSILKSLLKNFQSIPKNATGDIFGQIYEYFLGNFAIAEGQGGGEFFTPRSVVRVLVEIIEPKKGIVFDPACGSGGMFVQCGHFIEKRKAQNEEIDLYVNGQEKTLETANLAKMNLVVNGLRGEIKKANTYYEDHFNSFGKYDYVLANPPFNVDDVNLSKIEGDRRFNEYGIPRNKTKAKKKDKGSITVPNANYLWINLFATSLNANGRAGLVMANSASDARHSEADIRKTLIEKNLIYCMLTLPSNMFYTVTLPATLWFFDKAKTDDKILFIDARNIFTQVDRAHREFTEEQIQDIAIISRLRKGNRLVFTELVNDYFDKGFSRLIENRPKMDEVSLRVVKFMEENKVKDIPMLKYAFKDTDNLLTLFKEYKSTIDLQQIDQSNDLQRKLFENVSPFFDYIHEMVRESDRIVRHIEPEKGSDSAKNHKNLKLELEKLHEEVKAIEYFFKHIEWLQERFPNAKYEDVTGLCKLASMDYVKEQDYSLNPGRYVGVVIEEDGKTEEEFIEEMLDLDTELEKLNIEAHDLESIISHNIHQITGQE
jgi:type I restriction enzyme M protein